MNLTDIRNEYHKYKVIENNEGYTSVYYVTYHHKGYNQEGYALMRIFGPKVSDEQLCKAFGGSPYCGGMRGTQPEEYGKLFEITIYGCD